MANEIQSAGKKPQIWSLLRIGVVVMLLLVAVFELKAEAQQDLDTSLHITHRRIGIPPIVLASDDKPAFPVPPDNFKSVRTTCIGHGRVDTLFYFSRTLGTKRRALIYMPPGYSFSQTYPVVFLLHGIDGDKMVLFNYGATPHVILDNLLADYKIVPSIVIFPNGRAQPNDIAASDGFCHAAAFATSEYCLLDDLIPYVESHYKVSINRIHRALAGFSMGGGQALNFGMGHPDVFAWVGGFSLAPNTKAQEHLSPPRTGMCQPLKLLRVPCGNEDGLIFVGQSSTWPPDQAAGSSRLAHECRWTYHALMGT